MKPPRPITLDDEISEVIREIELRERAYPKMIESGRLRQEHADRRLDVMMAVLRRLRGLKGGAHAPRA